MKLKIVNEIKYSNMANMYSSLFAARAQLQLPQHIACSNSTFRRASFCPRWTIQTNRPLVTAASAPAPVPGITEIVDTPSLPSRIDSIPPEKLKTLRRLGLEMKDVIKIGRLGVGKGIIQQINNRWQTSEVTITTRKINTSFLIVSFASYNLFVHVIPVTCIILS